MATVGESVEIEAPLARVWDFYFDVEGWSMWLDQFATLVSSNGWPEGGGTLVWRSGAAGRGEVTEEVLEHVPRERHRVRFSDPSAEGELLATFAEAEAGTSVTLELTYELRSTGVFARVSDVLFVRSQMRASLHRTLLGLKVELEGAA
jgi:uncharacterized protein YndB with AHSA1/START domain